MVLTVQLEIEHQSSHRHWHRRNPRGKRCLASAEAVVFESAVESEERSGKERERERERERGVCVINRGIGCEGLGVCNRVLGERERDLFSLKYQP